MFEVIFTHRAKKSFKKIPKNYQFQLASTVDELSKNPFSIGTIKLINYPYAQYRRRLGDYRILFDVDDNRKIIVIADIRRRTSTTYQ